MKTFYINYDTPLDVCLNRNELNLDSIIPFSELLSAIVQNIYIVKRNFDPTNDNNSNHMLGINEEAKYNVIKKLLKHFQWYNENKKIFHIMEDYQLLYDEAQYIVENDLMDEISIFNVSIILKTV